MSRINAEVGDLPFHSTWQEVTSIKEVGKAPLFTVAPYDLPLHSGLALTVL